MTHRFDNSPGNRLYQPCRRCIEKRDIENSPQSASVILSPRTVNLLT